jgi:tape measure domain-containing protein
MSDNRETYIIELIDRNFGSLKTIADQMDKLRSKVDGLSDNIGDGSSGLSSRLGGLTKIVGWTALAGGVALAGREVYQLGANMEQTRVAFGTLLGSQKEANQLIEQVQQFGAVTPFETDELLKASRMLLSAGIGANDIQANLRMIGDVASGSAVPIEELAQIFQKATNKGKLQAEELNQFSERGIPILGELAKMFGVTKAEVMKMGEKGAITSDVMNQAFMNMTSNGGIFYDMMNKQSQTTAGRMSTVIDNLKNLAIKIFDIIQPAINGFISLAGAILENKGLLKDIAIVVGIVGGAFVAYKIAVGLATLFTGGFSTAFATLNAIMYANPIGAIIGAIALLVAGIVLAIRHFEEWGAMMLMFLSPAVGVIVGIIQSLRRNWDGLKSAFSTGGIIAGFKKLGMVILDALLMPMQQFLQLIAKIPGLGKIAGNGAEWIKSMRKKLNVVVPEETKKTVQNIQKKTGGKVQGVDDKTLKSIAQTQLSTKKKTKLKGTKTDLKSGISEISAGAPKVFNINIGSLIKEQKFETIKDLTDMKSIIRSEVSRLLLGVVNDVQTT